MMSRAVLCLSLLGAAPARAAPDEVVRLPSGLGNTGAGELEMAMRHQAPKHGEPRAAPVLILHGATFPSANAAAWPGEGGSWMEALADSGRDVWALDFVGYGASDRYPEMSREAATGEPLGGLDAMLEQVERAVAAIATRSRGERVVLVAHSAGTFVAGRFAELHPAQVAGLVLFGAPFPEGGPDPEERLPGAPYFDMTPEEQWESFEPAVRDAGHWTRKTALHWGEAWLASEPRAQGRTPPAVRVPYGLIAELRKMRRTGRSPYEPARIASPVLVVVGEWDAVTPIAQSLDLFRRLPGTEKRLAILGQGGHRMHLEHTRGALFAEVAAFIGGLP